jgi:hypothetical protein
MAAPRRESAEPAPDEALPQLRTLTLGVTRDGHFALVWLTSKGQRVLSRELLEVGTAEEADASWREEAYHRVWRQEPEPSAQARLETARRVAPHRGEDVLHGRGYGLVRKDGQWCLYEVEHQGDRVTRQEVVEVAKDFLYIWERFDIISARFLVQQDRRRA